MVREYSAMYEAKEEAVISRGVFKRYTRMQEISKLRKRPAGVKVLELELIFKYSLICKVLVLCINLTASVIAA